MRKNLIKRSLTYLLAITILLTSSGFTTLLPVHANTIEAESGEEVMIDNIQAESSDEMAAEVVEDSAQDSVDESVEDSEITSLENTASAEAPNGDYICTLQMEEANPNLRMVDNSSSLPISFSSYEVFWPGHGIMYVANDDKYVDSMGTWRLVYCYDQGKTTPSGTLTFNGWSNKKVAYAMYYGSLYWGKTCRYAPYSTGDWKMDVMATQAAIWVLNGQYTLDHVVNYIIDCCNGTATDAQRQIVEAATQKIVNDANKESNYTGWNSDGWFDLSLSGKSTFNVTGYKNTWTNNGKGYYVSGGSFKTTFKSYYGYDMRSQITSFNVSVPDGVEVVKADNKTFSNFSLRISEDQYNEWKKTGKSIKVKVTMKIPRLWNAGIYKLADNNYQRTTLFTYKSKSDTATFTKTITLKIPKEETPNGKLQIKKSSALPNITDDNNCYSLEGAEYAIYSDANCNTEVGILTTGADGTTPELTLETNTYYVREVSSPKGFLLDTNTYKVTITDEHATTAYLLKVDDVPLVETVNLLLKKVDADTNESVAQNTATLEGAEFTVKYYDVTDTTTDPAESGYSPLRTWVFATDKNGCLYLDDAYRVSGDDLYLSESGTPSIPIGTITIQETKQPEGYLQNNEVFVIPINPDSSEGVTSYTAAIIPDNVFKLVLTKMETGTEKKIPGAVFEHLRPTGEKETLETDENGQLSFVGLEWGDHIIKELSVMDGYLINKAEIRFTVSEDNSVEIQSPSTLAGAGITLEHNDNSNINVTVEDELAPYSLRILKKNQNGLTLAGAEFTLYSDKDCTNAIASKVTDSDGTLIFENLTVGKKLYCKETKAPIGYALPDEAIVYEIYADASPLDGVFDFYINGEKHTINSTDETSNIYLSGFWGNQMINLQVTNNTGMLLPETGSNMTIVLCLFGITLMTGVLITNRKKKTKG